MASAGTMFNFSAGVEIMLRGAEVALRSAAELAELVPKIGVGIRDTTISAETSARLTDAVRDLRNLDRSRSADPGPYVGTVTAVHITEPSIPYGRGAADYAYTESYFPPRSAATQFPATRPQPSWRRNSDPPERVAQVSDLQSIMRGSVHDYAVPRWSWEYDSGRNRSGREPDPTWEFLNVKVGEGRTQHSDVEKLLRKQMKVPDYSVDLMFDPDKVNEFARNFMRSSFGRQVRILDPYTAVFTSGDNASPSTVGLIRSTAEPLDAVRVNRIVRGNVGGVLSR